MEQLDAARDDLLDDNAELVGHVKDVKEVEKRLRHRLLPRNAWRLVPFFELFMSAPKDELERHQWYVLCCHKYILSYTCVYVGIYVFYTVGIYVFIYVFILEACRYLGLFGDHIVPSVMYRYTQVLL